MRALRARAAHLRPLAPALRALDEALREHADAARFAPLRSALAAARFRAGAGGAVLAAIPAALGLDHEARLLGIGLGHRPAAERAALGRELLDRLLALLADGAAERERLERLLRRGSDSAARDPRELAGGLWTELRRALAGGGAERASAALERIDRVRVGRALGALLAAEILGEPPPAATPDDGAAPGLKGLLLASAATLSAVDPARAAMERVLATLEASQLLTLASRARGGTASWRLPVEGSKAPAGAEARVGVRTAPRAEGGAARRAFLELELEDGTARVELALRPGACHVRVDAEGPALQARLSERLPALEQRLAAEARRVEVALDPRLRESVPETPWLDEHLLVDLRG